MEYRHYDAGLGRFLSRDPIGFQGGLNLYSMAANSPVTFTDHTGLEPGAWTGEKHAVFVGDYASDPSSWVIQNGPMEPGRQPLRSSAEGGSLPSLYDKRNIRFLADYLGVDESTILMSGMMLGAISFGLGGRGQPCPGQMQGPSMRISPHQFKHIVGHNDYIPGRSILNADPVALSRYAGTGQQVGKLRIGLPGSKERVNFGQNIGSYVSGETSLPTSLGIIHYSKRGIHIIPSNPGGQ